MRLTRPMATAALLLTAASVVRASSSDKKIPTGPNGGVLVAIEPFKAELLVWETGLELMVYDKHGKLVRPRSVSARARVVVDGGRLTQEVTFAPQFDRLRAEAEMAGVRALKATLHLRVGDQELQPRQVEWTIETDRGRLWDTLNI